MGFNEEVYEVVKRIPKGKVMTYGGVAQAIGRPRAARAVGTALHNNPQPVIIPCHRIVNREGRLTANFAFGGIDAQALLLMADGVEVKDNTVDLKKYRYRIGE